MSKVDFGDEFYREHLRKVFKRMQDAYQYQEICNLYDGDCEIVLAYIYQLETQIVKLENNLKKIKATADKARR